MEALTNAVKTIRHSNAVAAGQTTITPAAGVNMAGFNACRFLVLWGAITAGGAQSVEVHTSADDGVADAYTALENSKVTVADDHDNKMTIVDVVRPIEADAGGIYLKCVINRATQNSAVDGIIAELYGPAKKPVAADSTVQGQEIHISPAEGTA